MAKVEYEFPTHDERDGWERDVRAAIQAGTLSWHSGGGAQWILSGACPRCGHTTTQFVDLDVVIADAMNTTAFDATAQTDLMIEVVCACKEVQPHKDGAQGCGFGRGLVISMANPRGD
jgi:hypothetical protein